MSRRIHGRGAGVLAVASLVLLSSASRSHAQTTDGVGTPPKPDEEIQAGQLSKLPKQIKFVEAEYPPEALEKGIEAEVILLLDINAEGKVESVGIAQPADPPDMGFDEAAMIAAQQFEFEPAEMDGKPIAVQITYKYKFVLKPKEPPAPPPTPGEGKQPTEEAPEKPTRPPVINFAGKLLERGTRLPLTGVTVTVFREEASGPVGFEAVSDDKGVFVFYDLAPGEWKVLVEPPGYYPLRTAEEIVEGQRTDVTYHVERASYNPYDVTVTAKRPRKEVSRTVIGAEEIDKVPGGAGDPLTVVQNFAGVARSDFGGQVIVRGSAPEDSRVFVDGTEVPLIYHFGGLRSVIPVGILDSIEFYPGNFSPKYGRLTGGVIDVRLKDVKPKKVGGYADVSLLDTGLYLEAPIGDKGGIAAAVRRSYFDAIIVAAVPDNAPVSVLTAPRYYDFQLLGSYRPAPAHNVRAFFVGSDDRLEILFKDPAEVSTELEGNTFSTEISFYRSLLSYRYVPSETFDNTLRVSQGRNWIYFKAGQLFFDLNVYSAQIRDEARLELSDQYALSFGTDFAFYKYDLDIRFPRPPKEGEPQQNISIEDPIVAHMKGEYEWLPAFFAEGELKPVKGLLVLPGLRFDHFDRTGENHLQPRLTARWNVAGPFTVKGGVGLFVQEPDAEETSAEFGNPDLITEKAIHYSAGVEYKPRPWLTLDVTGFYKDMSDLVSPTDEVVQEGDGVRPLIYDNNGEGRVYGMELVARHEFNDNLAGWIAYTLSRAKRRDSGSTDERLFDFDQTHIFTAIASYVLPRNWQVGARMRIVSGNPTTPIIGSVFNAGTDQYDPIYGPVNSARNPLFHQFDLRLDKRWIYQNWMLNAYLDIQNVYDSTNPEGLRYNYDFSESRPTQGMPIVTILGLRAEF